MRVLGIAVALVMSTRAFAAPRDNMALEARYEAIQSDYAAGRFDEAAKKLRQALARCGSYHCIPRVRAQLHVDLALVYGTGLKRLDDAKLEFIAALNEDSSVVPRPDLTPPELIQLFKNTKQEIESEAAREGGAIQPDIVHVSPTEQFILTPVPLYVELPQALAAAKVQLRYSAVGASDWKSLEMTKFGKGYAAAIPCSDIGSTTGDLRYYVQVINADGDVVAFSGSRNAPHVTAIKNQLTGEAPHLPGQAAPGRCQNPDDCPPGLPGCTRDRKRVVRVGTKQSGAVCADDRECARGLYCNMGTCERGSSDDAKCESDSDCAEGDSCHQGECIPAVKRNWLSVAVQQDALLLPGAKDACIEQLDYACFFDTDNAYEAGKPYTPATGEAGNVEGGPAMATTRVLIGFDRVITNNLMLGLRVGYAFGGAPARPDGPDFFAYHLEARVSYWFGARPFGARGLRPYVVVAAGGAQVDAKRELTITNQDPQPSGTPVPEEAKVQKIVAWRKTGTNFVALGAGAMFAITPNSGVLGELKFQQLIGTSGTGAGVLLGYTHGL